MDDLPLRLAISEAAWARTPVSLQSVVRTLAQVVQALQLQHQTALEQFAMLQPLVTDCSSAPHAAFRYLV